MCLHTILPCASVLSPLSKALAQGMTARLLQPGLLVFPQVYVAREALSNIYLNLINYLYETK